MRTMLLLSLVALALTMTVIFLVMVRLTHSRVCTQRPYVKARTPGLGIAANDELLFVLNLEFLPGGSSPTHFVRGIDALCHDPFPALASRLSQERSRIGGRATQLHRAVSVHPACAQ